MQHNAYRLYGAQISYYTGKVRAYLRWKNIPYEEISADVNVYRQIILPRVGHPVIPVLLTPEDDTLQDTSCIIDELENRHSGPSVYPDTPRQKLAAMLLELYGDEWLLIPAMHYRWHHNREFAIRSFGELNAPEASPEEQLAIGNKRAGPFAQSAVMLGAEPHMHAAIEASYEALLGELDAHFAHYPYLLGTRPSIGDLGLIGPLYAHQYRDPYSGDLMRRIAPRVAAWVGRMQSPATPLAGEFLPDDEIAPTLLPVLRRMMREHIPELQNAAQAFREWLDAHPGERDVPRSIGMHAYELEGNTGQRTIRPYCFWMLQRVRDVYRSFDAAQRAQADELLDTIGGGAFRDFQDPPRVERNILSVRLAS